MKVNNNNKNRKLLSIMNQFQNLVFDVKLIVVAVIGCSKV